jgi:hypothetical protein
MLPVNVIKLKTKKMQLQTASYNCLGQRPRRAGLYREVESKNKEVFDVELYPNPAGNNFFISIKELEAQEINLEISNSHGQLISVKNILLTNGLINVDSKWPSGMYLVKIKNSKNEEVVKKLIVN